MHKMSATMALLDLGIEVEVEVLRATHSHKSLVRIRHTPWRDQDLLIRLPDRWSIACSAYLTRYHSG